MAQQAVKIDVDKLCCSICLDLPKDPVTIPCGHNYCMNCIKRYWDVEEKKEKIHSCPQCRQTFIPRPALVKNTMLAELVEELKKTEIQAAPADHCYAEDGDVACDVCTERKLKAVKSCLYCVVSYCEQHLQPHYHVDALKKHKLVDPSKKLQENICPHHNEVMKIFCRTDQQCICYLCTLDEHKGHNTVPASTEWTERQKDLKPFCEKIQLRIQKREENVKVLQQEVDNISSFADKGVRDSGNIFSELVFLISKGGYGIKQQIRAQQETEINRVKVLLEKLEQELTEVKRNYAELEKLSCTEDHTQFLHTFQLLSNLITSTEVPCPKPRPLLYFEDVASAACEVKDKLQSVFCEGLQKVSQSVTEVDVLLPKPEPKTRAEFLQYSSQLTLDPNTAGVRLLLTDDNRKATFVSKKQSYPSHPERFMKKSQVLSREALTGRHYFEVEWSGFGIYVAVAYKSISRTGDDSEFGNNDKSWALESSDKYEFTHDCYYTSLSGPDSPIIGVYLDRRAGILSFYSVSDTMTLLHKVKTTFTEPLYAGLRACHYLGSNSSGMFCKLEQEQAATE